MLLKNFLPLLIIFICLQPAYAAKRLHPEAEYQSHWCNARNGITEYKLKDKARVDCLLPDMAVEFDFANKWAECIGQSLYYGRMTRRQPVCVLIMENGDKDLKYLYRLRKAAYKKGIKTFTMKPETIEKTSSPNNIGR